MIYVTQGHQNGIGLEVFLKSYLCFNSINQKKFILVSNKKSLNLVLSKNHLKHPKNLNVLFTDNTQDTQTIAAMNLAISKITNSDILLTLPSSKDQFILDGNVLSGHTEYFREIYKNSSISMNFISKDMITTLLSDHIPISKVSKYLTEDLILNKIQITIDSILKIKKISEVIFSGINPHCGEDGLMGDEDKRVENSIKKLKSMYSEIIFTGPLPGDTMHFNHKDSSQLLVYAYHDQGLTIFKQYNGLTGINTTLGLPFIRVSPDHGTAFNIAGKNEANYLGMNYLLNEILSWI
jgi:4-hydroxythreonine-4-phosphate dehydrogenase